MKKDKKYVCLIFSESKDFTTNKVIEWVNSFGVDVFRYNESDKINELRITLSINSKLTNICFDSKKIISVWYRRYQSMVLQLDNKVIIKQVDRHLHQEIETFKNHVFNILNNSPHIKIIGKNNQYIFPTYINKLYSIVIAKKCGLKIPDTIISTDINTIKEFKKKHERIITKPISDPIFLWGEESHYAIYTSLIEESDLLNKNEILFPVKLQQCIDKEFEVRVFFLEGKCYSAAIFSQNDVQTKIDFRQYNQNIPNRIVPFQLPIKYEKKIIKFMNYVGINTGSIDIIVDKNNNYYFLELNPVGQFGMISKPCNYYLEREVALFLSLQ